MEPEYVQNHVDIYQEYPPMALLSSTIFNPQTTSGTSGSINITNPFIQYPNTTVGTWTTGGSLPFVQVPLLDPGPSNEEVDEAIRSIRRTIEKHNGE